MADPGHLALAVDDEGGRDAALTRGCSKALIYKWITEKKLTKHSDASGRTCVDVDELEELTIGDPPTSPVRVAKSSPAAPASLTSTVSRRSSEEAAHRQRVESLLAQVVAELHTIKMLVMLDRGPRE